MRPKGDISDKTVDWHSFSARFNREGEYMPDVKRNAGPDIKSKFLSFLTNTNDLDAGGAAAGGP